MKQDLIAVLTDGSVIRGPLLFGHDDKIESFSIAQKIYGNNLTYDSCSLQTQVPARICEKDGVLTVSQGAETHTWDKTYHAIKSLVYKNYVFSLHQSIDCLSYGGIKQTEIGSQQTFCLSVFNLKTE